jgi:hypothetical protein
MTDETNIEPIKQEEAKPVEQAQQEEKKEEKKKEKSFMDKSFFEMAKELAGGHVASKGIIGSMKGIVGSTKTLSKFNALTKMAVKELKNGNRARSIEMDKRAMRVLEELINDPGNASMFPLMKVLHEKLEEEIKFIESGEPIENYHPKSIEEMFNSPPS